MAERFTLIWSARAREDLDAILEYVAANDGLDRSIAIYEDLRRRIAALIRFPRRARAVPELRAFGLADFRELVVAPYRVFFRLDRRTVVLLGVVDGRRDLGELLIERALRHP